MTMRVEKLKMLLSGIDLEQARRRNAPRWGAFRWIVSEARRNLPVTKRVLV